MREYCSICSKEIEDDDPAYASTPGVIECGAFEMMIDKPWENIRCTQCNILVQEAIDHIKRCKRL